jgi:hypothetical protein
VQKQAAGEPCLKPRRGDKLAQAAPVLVVFSGIHEGGALILAESAGAVLRWLHVIAGIAWIGSSFYFIHLDLSLKPRPGLPAGVKGDEWQVRGDGFYP